MTRSTEISALSADFSARAPSDDDGQRAENAMASCATPDSLYQLHAIEQMPFLAITDIPPKGHT